ncbi:ribosomal protein L7/L12 [Streptomyces sp. NBC_00006]|uniref:ribosomal protein L7/L12 n=1 Tax=unclassified Streptomyces TaxID=2593676 RepID=UPI002254AD4C|nr:MULTISPECIES: ribosomal protein L7/L12 [unclassified Streptomyces]MCX5537581.1 ribosomal protein L7/L12 [Streptomyces sp. NBC_00006]
MDSAAILILLVGVLIAIGTIERKVDRADRRTARVERKLDLVIEHLGIETGTLVPGLDGVRALVRDGKKIEAIKAYREATGVGLKEAKDEVDRIESGQS